MGVSVTLGLFEPVEIRFRWRPAGPDAGDDHVIETALNGRADAVVTFNLRDFAEASRRFGVVSQFEIGGD